MRPLCTFAPQLICPEAIDKKSRAKTEVTGLSIRSGQQTKFGAKLFLVAFPVQRCSDNRGCYLVWVGELNITADSNPMTPRQWYSRILSTKATPEVCFPPDEGSLSPPRTKVDISSPFQSVIFLSQPTVPLLRYNCIVSADFNGHLLRSIQQHPDESEYIIGVEHERRRSRYLLVSWHVRSHQQFFHNNKKFHP